MVVDNVKKFGHDASEHQGEGNREHEYLGVFPLRPILLAGIDQPPDQLIKHKSFMPPNIFRRQAGLWRLATRAVWKTFPPEVP